MTEKLTSVAYSIAATAQGGRTGRVTSADGVVDMPLVKPGAGEEAGANPETFFAAGYAACFNGALNLVASKQDLDTSASTVTADVSFGQTDSGFGLAVAIEAAIPGVDEQTAQALAEKAHEVCPYSKATRGNIEVKVTGRPA